jgi:hypothetical protein
MKHILIVFSIVIVCSTAFFSLSLPRAHAQTPATIEEQEAMIEQLKRLIELLKQVIALKAQLAKLQGQLVLPIVPVIAPPPVVAPIISNVSTSATKTSITVSWTTNKDTRSRVEYKASFELLRSITDDEWLQKRTHVMKNLTPGTFYTIRITVHDSLGNVAVYPDQLVKTVDAPDKTKPTISGIQVSNVTRSGAVISWTTDEDTKSKLYYGTIDPLSLSAKTTKVLTDTSLARTHVFVLSGLEPFTTYYYVFEAIDAAGNKERAEQRRFSTSY